MAQRRVMVAGVGEVILAKRRSSTNMRLSVNSNGQIRVGMPYWAPYEAGLMFVRSKRVWIQKHMAEQAPRYLKNGDRIGKSHRLKIATMQSKNTVADIRVSATSIEVMTPLSVDSIELQQRLNSAAERALKKQATQILPGRIDMLSQRYKLPYNDLKIRKLTSRWGSCSTKKNISLSYFLMQLPWELIDYVILHELVHTKYPNHGADFWNYMYSQMPSSKNLRKQLKNFKPRVEPLDIL